MTDENLPTVIAENYMTIAPDLTIKVLVLSDGQRVIPEEDMRRAGEWLGVNINDLSAYLAEPARKGGE